MPFGAPSTAASTRCSGACVWCSPGSARGLTTALGVRVPVVPWLRVAAAIERSAIGWAFQHPDSGSMSLSLTTLAHRSELAESRSVGGGRQQQGDDPCCVACVPTRPRPPCWKPMSWRSAWLVSSKLASFPRWGMCPTTITSVVSSASRRAHVVGSSLGARPSPSSVSTSTSRPQISAVWRDRVLPEWKTRLGRDTEPVDRPVRHPGDVVGAAVGERPLRVFVLRLGLPVLDQVDDRGRDGTVPGRGPGVPAGPPDHPRWRSSGCSPQGIRSP